MTRLPAVLVTVTVVTATLLAGCGSTAGTALPASPSTGWVDESVTFPASGVTIDATFRHATGTTSALPAALLIAGSGPTDRNGNSTQVTGRIDTLRTLAGWLSDDGVASLRYDKLGSGQTGLGP
ncbi:MAG TPA: hypothetical protein VH352_05150, partial [Pseudonocardiaceae bacterium]|nr:hypothetical protein [Pseudonocardiaceae bacterium]